MKNILFLLLCVVAGALVGGFGAYVLAPQKPNPIVNLDGMQLRRSDIEADNQASTSKYETYGIPIGMVAGLVVGAVIARNSDRKKEADIRHRNRGH
jgi:hypothetical protein